MTLPNRTSVTAPLGTVAAPTSGKTECTVVRDKAGFRMDFAFKGTRVAITDATTNGSYGSTKIFDFDEGAITFLGSRQDYTRFREGTFLTTAVGDAVIEIGIGTAAIAAAADGTLGNGTNENVGQAVGITMSEGTGTGTAVDGAKTTALNGTATAIDLYLNISGTAATVDANSYLDVWGTSSVYLGWMADD